MGEDTVDAQHLDVPPRGEARPGTSRGGRDDYY